MKINSMVEPNNIFRIGFLISLMFTLLLVSCNPKPSQTQLLHILNVHNPEQFSSLSTCRQVQIYAIVGSESIDIDHRVVFVQPWMDDVISRQPPQDVETCIAEYGQYLFSHWNDDPDQYINNSYQIHALIYKAIDLKLLAYPEIKNLVHQAICGTNIYEKGRLDIYFYVNKHPGMTNFPSVDEMEKDLCR
jgi:hypothetical protein